LKTETHSFLLLGDSIFKNKKLVNQYCKIRSYVLWICSVRIV